MEKNLVNQIMPPSVEPVDKVDNTKIENDVSVTMLEKNVLDLIYMVYL